jgi:hypothetical protein
MALSSSNAGSPRASSRAITSGKPLERSIVLTLCSSCGSSSTRRIGSEVTGFTLRLS